MIKLFVSDSSYVSVGEYDTAGDRFLLNDSLMLWAGEFMYERKVNIPYSISFLYFYTQMIENCATFKKFIFTGKSVPKDKIRREIVNKYVDFVVFCIMSALTITGMVVALCFLLINVYFRSHKYIVLAFTNFYAISVVHS